MFVYIVGAVWVVISLFAFFSGSNKMNREFKSIVYIKLSSRMRKLLRLSIEPTETIVPSVVALRVMAYILSILIICYITFGRFYIENILFFQLLSCMQIFAMWMPIGCLSAIDNFICFLLRKIYGNIILVGTCKWLLINEKGIKYIIPFKTSSIEWENIAIVKVESITNKRRDVKSYIYFYSNDTIPVCLIGNKPNIVNYGEVIIIELKKYWTGDIIGLDTVQG